MRWELPLLKRCCFCLPLRYSLLVLGYLRLVISTLATTGVLFIIIRTVEIYNHKKARYRIAPFNVTVILLSLILTVADVIFNIIFIVSCHTKNTILMKKYYSYSIFIWVLLILNVIYNVAESLYFMNRIIEHFSVNGFIYFELMDLLALFGVTVLQGYIILLVRSEMIKLNDGCQFRFVNNAAEAECTLDLAAEKDSKQKNEVNKNDKGIV